MTVQPTDIAIFLVSFAACIYCILLSRRLKALQNTKDGLGATIMALSQSISTMSTTTQDTRLQAGEIASRLAQLMDESSAMCTRLEVLTGTIKTTHDDAIGQVNSAQIELSTMMRDILDQSRDRILEMSTLIRQMRALSEQAGADGDVLAYRVAGSNTHPRSKSVYRYES